MDRNGILAHVSELAAATAGAGRAVAVPAADTPLANGGYWLDSVALVDLLIACESAFGVSFDDTRGLASSLTTLGTLASLIEHQLTKRGPDR